MKRYTYICISICAFLKYICPGYVGKFLGKFNTYHHQVSGEIYAVDQSVLFIKDFVYDGNSADAYFWAGSTNRPSSQGFIVPNEYGRTNVLDRYLHKNVTVELPRNMLITQLKWFSVFDITLQESFGEVYIPEGFEPPESKILGELLSFDDTVLHSGSVIALNAKTLILQMFTYSGNRDHVLFRVGEGYHPSPQGWTVPDEDGYLDAIQTYDEKDVRLDLPGTLTLFNINWFSVYDFDNNSSLGHIHIPKDLNVPPSLLQTVSYQSNFLQCQPLHKRLQISWEHFGPAITLELASQLEDNQYVAFGFSGVNNTSQMIGGDCVIVYLQGALAYAVDYNLTARTQCLNILGQQRGVCPDDMVGGTQDYQIFGSKQKDGLSIITFRRSLISADNGDIDIDIDKPMHVIWAIGYLNNEKNPTFHSIYPKRNVEIHFGRSFSREDCLEFTITKENQIESWGVSTISDPQISKFVAVLGPPGGYKGYFSQTGRIPSPFVWYINGLLAPELYLQREKMYTFIVRGGNNPHEIELYHPFIISTDPVGAYHQLTELQRKYIQILAGVEYSRRGQSQPTATGSVCQWISNGTDTRKSDSFLSFQKFRNTLKLICETDSKYGILKIIPNNSWPDKVYYNSYIQPNMGNVIYIVDDFKQNSAIALNTKFSSWKFIYLNFSLLLYLQKF